MRQKYEAAVSVRPVDTLQPDAVGVGVGRRLFPCIALVDERHASTLRLAQRKQAQRTASTDSPVTAWTGSATAATGARSGSLVGVTTTASD